MKPRISWMIALLACATIALAVSAIPSARASLGFSPIVRIPIVRAHGKGDPQAAASFSHWSHDEFPCYSCHPSIFPQQRLGFTHDELDAGRFCATCHDGKRSWSVDDAPECETCHHD